MALLPKNFLAAKQRDVTGDMHGQALGLWLSWDLHHYHQVCFHMIQKCHFHDFGDQLETSSLALDDQILG